ncbi:rod shape-determining protein MreD [candidate division KSB1 bacterium]|nr:rod shape-determining protein MreD [candidate division KSB1 bacterium]
MKYVKYAIIFFIVLVIDLNVIEIISIKGITPDIILIYLIFISLRETQAASTIIGFSAGLLQDLFSLSMLGLSSLTKSISCFITAFFQRAKRNYSIMHLTIVFFIITVIHDRIYQFIFLLGTDQKLFKSFLYHSVPKAIYTTIVALILNFIFGRILWDTREI